MARPHRHRRIAVTLRPGPRRESASPIAIRSPISAPRRGRARASVVQRAGGEGCSLSVPDPQPHPIRSRSGFPAIRRRRRGARAGARTATQRRAAEKRSATQMTKDQRHQNPTMGWQTTAHRTGAGTRHTREDTCIRSLAPLTGAGRHGQARTTRHSPCAQIPHARARDSARASRG